MKRISAAFMICAMLLMSAFSFSPSWLFTYGGSLPGYAPQEGTIHESTRPTDMLEHLEYEEIDRREEGLELEGRIPYLTQSAGPIHARINSLIDRTVAAKISDAREIRSRSLTFNYEAYFSTPYMSIILKSTAATASSKTEVVSINFNVNTGTLITAEDAVGPHVVQLADRLLLEMIRRDPERYNSGFSGMRTDQAFSLTDREITFWFNEFQLAPGFEGIIPLSLRLDDIKVITLEPHEYHIREGFNLKMVPVRIVGDLGYDYFWHPDTRSVSVYHNGEFVIEVTDGINNFVRESRFTRSLEAAPEFVYGTTYVPISFFDQILSLVAFSIDDMDNITFASYPVTDAWFER